MKIAAAACPQGVHKAISNQARRVEGNIGHAKFGGQHRCAGEEGNAQDEVGFVTLQKVNTYAFIFYPADMLVASACSGCIQRGFAPKPRSVRATMPWDFPEMTGHQQTGSLQCRMQHCYGHAH